MKPELAQAVAIFKELGWTGATPEQALSLPLGTPEQRRTALAGLKSGDWTELQVNGNTTSVVSIVGVDHAMLSLFAVRVGVDARRAVQVLPRWNKVPDRLLAEILADRGPAFAANFFAAACLPGRDFGPPFGSVPIRLLAHHHLPVPDNLGYLEDWAACAEPALRPHDDPNMDPTLEPLVAERFAEHVRMGIALGLAGLGPLSKVITEGVRRGDLARDEAVELVFAALDAAGRPGDRKAWLQVLDELGVIDDELLAHVDALIALLANGDGFLIERIAPVLIARVDDSALIEVLLIVLSVRVKKALKVVLQAIGVRSRPQGAEELAPQLVELAADRDRAVARLASGIIEKWALEFSSDETPPSQVQGMWQPTPPLWQVQRFELGEVTPEALTDLAAELIGRPEGVDDVTVERFLAVANAVAYEDLEAAKSALRGVRGFPDAHGLRPVPTWLAGEWPKWGLDHDKHVSGLLEAREFAVFQRLGRVPCLLSEPSLVDLSITLGDLVARLENYLAAGVSATEADLFLALTRVDPSSSMPELIAKLEQLSVPVVLQSGALLKDAAGPIIAHYLANPIAEPEMVINPRYGHWVSTRITLRDPLNRPAPVAALLQAGFPDRLAQYISTVFAVFPHWGDAALGDVGWSDEVQHHIGLLLRQVARRAEPMPPGATINFLAVQRSMSAIAAPDGTLAVSEAWERGLLRPGVADVAYLDWSSTPPTNLAALAKGLFEVAQLGILSLVWPVLDDVISASLRAPRLSAGTAEIAEAIQTLLPETVAAVKEGLAAPSALDLPGIRALAARSGSSRAVVVAREIAAQLPPPTVIIEPAASPPDALLDPPFDEVWPAAAGTLPAVPDGVTVIADWLNPDAPTRVLAFILVLPDMPNVRFVVWKTDWIYDLEMEGQCRAWRIQPGISGPGVQTIFADHEGFVPQGQSSVWLHWEADLSRLVVTEHRNWREDKDGPLSRGGMASSSSELRASVSPLSNALVTVGVGLLGNDGDHSLTGARLLRILTGQDYNRYPERIGSASVTQAVRALLNSPAVSMAKLVKPLEKDIRLLPTLWPLLTEPIRATGAIEGTLPTWLNRVLDVSLRHAPYLAEAARRSLIPQEAATWPGLAEIAARPDKSTAVTKAKKLRAALNLTPRSDRWSVSEV